EDIKPLYTRREKFSHKGDFGHSLIIGGSYGKIGAVTLTSKSALSIGSGLVTAHIPKCGYQIVQTSLVEAMVEVDGENELELFNSEVDATVIGIGIGMGMKPATVIGFEAFLKRNKKTLVLDADALNIISKNNKLLNLLPINSVLTPHPKEFERLVGGWKNDYDKLKKLRSLSKKYTFIIVLKGAYTVIAHEGELYFNTTGNPALATAGSGDVLTGMITGLIAQNYGPFEATILGVYLHGKTAEIAMKTEVYETFLASDIITYLSHAITDLLSKEPKSVQPSTKNSQNIDNSKPEEGDEMYI
ncbi:UNVERIFIED_CONTAM: hypothetical protein GTU68_027390, partial [Idotea baltica]|nr:hypothetical protein [Idotea baltica]